MITRELIERLGLFDTHGAGVLSIYLSLDPARQVQYSHRVVFEDLVRSLDGELAEAQRGRLDGEAARIQKWLQDQEPKGKAVSIFSCTPAGLWEAHYLPAPLRDHAAFEPWVDVAGLLEAIDEYERYAVAFVDKRRARLFTVFLGAIETGERFEDEVPNRHHQGGVAQMRLQRQHEAHVHTHLKRVEQHLSHLLLQCRFDRLIIAGPEEAATELRRLLPKPLAERVVAIVPGEMSATDAQILERTLEIAGRFERESEDQMLARVIDTASAGGRATCGIQPTLDALRLGEIQTLVVADGARASGGECPKCGLLQLGSTPTCAACGERIERTSDLLHRAMGRALQQADHVEVLHDRASERLRQAGGGLGAFLRFRA